MLTTLAVEHKANLEVDPQGANKMLTLTFEGSEISSDSFIGICRPNESRQLGSLFFSDLSLYEYLQNDIQ